MQDPAEAEQRMTELLDWAASGAIEFQIHARYPLQDAAKAHTALESRESSGKLLLIPGT